MATWTFHEYLRRYANIHISWDHRQLKLEDLPNIKHMILEPQDLVRFYQNPCLYGYSFAFWTWESDWSNHLGLVYLHYLSPLQLQIRASVRERPLRAMWARIASPTLPSAAVREPTLFL